MLGLDLECDAHLLWLAEEALLSDQLPKGWVERVDASGRIYWKNKKGRRDPVNGKPTTYEHPTDEYYRAMAEAMQEKDDRGRKPAGGVPALPVFASTRKGQVIPIHS